MADRKSWTDADLTLLQRMFVDAAYPMTEMMATLRRSRASIYHKAKVIGLVRNNPRYKSWTLEEEQLLAEMYVDANLSREEIEQTFGRSWVTISSKANILRLRRPHPTHVEIKRDFFRVIDADEKAYWLGFLAADGSVVFRSDKYQVSLGLQDRDLHWLQKFRDHVAPGSAITQKRGGSSVVSIASKEMVLDLVQYGLVPGKAKTLTFPGQLPKHLVLPFLLGYFDGDGSFHQYKKINTFGWSLLGTEAFLNVARDHLIAASGADIKAVRRHNRNRVPHLYELRAYGPNAVRLDRVLNANGLGLPRKHLT